MFVSLQEASNYANRILSIADQYANRTLDVVSHFNISTPQIRFKINYGNVQLRCLQHFLVEAIAQFNPHGASCVKRNIFYERV